MQVEKAQGEDDKALEFENTIRHYRLTEDADDAKHSQNNTQILNQRYAGVFNLFFGSKIRFNVWIVLYLTLYILPSISDCFTNQSPFIAALIQSLAHKAFYTLNFIFLALLTFPTAKGIRRLFREIITRISKKPIR